MANEKATNNIPSACVAQAGVTGSVAGTSVFTFADPGDGFSIVVGSISWSYSDDPTGGSWTLSDGTTSLSGDVVTGGPGFIIFNPPLKFADSTAVSLTMAAGGDGITAKCHACGYKQKAGGV